MRMPARTSLAGILPPEGVGVGADKEIDSSESPDVAGEGGYVQRAQTHDSRFISAG